MNASDKQKAFEEEKEQNRAFFCDLAKKDINALYDFYERHDIATMDIPAEEREEKLEELLKQVEKEIAERHGVEE